MFVAKSDLSNVFKNKGDMGADEEGKNHNEIDEELLNEMCKFSSMSTANNLKKQGENGIIERRNGGGLQGGNNGGEAKSVVEDFDLNLDGDMGTDGRPRIREEIKLPPNYENIDLFDPKNQVLFQGDLMKYKAGYNPTFLGRWAQVTEKAFKLYKNRCNAITCNNKPLMAIPVAAIKRVEKVQFEIVLNAREADKYQPYIQNQIEIYLKDDFLDLYLRPTYE